MHAAPTELPHGNSNALLWNNLTAPKHSSKWSILGRAVSRSRTRRRRGGGPLTSVPTTWRRWARAAFYTSWQVPNPRTRSLVFHTTPGASLVAHIPFISRSASTIAILHLTRKPQFVDHNHTHNDSTITSESLQTHTPFVFFANQSWGFVGFTREDGDSSNLHFAFSRFLQLPTRTNRKGHLLHRCWFCFCSCEASFGFALSY